MHMHAIRLSGGLALYELPAIHRKECLEYRVDEQQHREPRRYLGMPCHEKDGQLRQPEPKQVGAAVSQEDFSLGVVPGEKPEQGSDHRKRGDEEERIAYQS